MLNRMNAYIVPLIAFLSAITGIVLIGETLLNVNRLLERFGEIGKLGAPAAALILIAIIGGHLCGPSRCAPPNCPRWNGRIPARSSRCAR